MAWKGEVEDGTGWGGLVASKSEQRAEARQAALEKDAARYRWLRSRVPGSTYRVMGVIYSEGGAGVDAAIDAAMAGQARIGAA